MNSVYDFSAYQHSVMLGDQVRLDAYHGAIKNQVKAGMVVAEVGTGTGILSAYAASQTKSPVYAIEFKPSMAALAKSMMKAAGLEHVQVLQGKSFDLILDPEPEILVTETIGAVGPEEHIVEICYDFKKRHPKVKSIVPARLRMYAEPIRSATIRQSEQLFLDYFFSASYGTFDYEAIKPELLKNRSTHLLFDSLTDAEKVGERIELVEYVLGETPTSAFEKTLDLSSAGAADAYHIYFEADLDDKFLLSTHFSKPETHWSHAYARRPSFGKQLTVSYVSSAATVDVLWHE
jgi:predicted RNA methylase